mmetsp:Transcript_33939/g.39332  ORF Transcript_33939/g.39332 Transcript_33939/m.39332 type:complete len:433 (+) Transcript_33939:172-1470(+)
MSISDKRAEAAVKKLAKLPQNVICPNCGTSKKFGFGTVCIKFLTFVCNECKSSHQAISHRCKSLTMSAWTQGEALALQKAGNDIARQTWLASAPPIGTMGRPKPGDSLNVYKSFVVDVYERKKYWDAEGVKVNELRQMQEDDKDEGLKITAAVKRKPPKTRKKVATLPQKKVDHYHEAAPNVNDTPSAAAPQPVVDLLDFSSCAVSTGKCATSSIIQQEAESIFDPFNNNGDILQGIRNPVGTKSNAAEMQPKVNMVDAITQNYSQQSFDPFGNCLASSISTSTVTNKKPAEETSTALLTSAVFDPFGTTKIPSSNNSAQQEKFQPNNSVPQKPVIMNSNNSIPMINAGGIGMMQNSNNPMMAQQLMMQQQNFMQQQQMMALMMNQQQMQQQQQQVMSANTRTGINITTMDTAQHASTNQVAKKKDPFADLF